MEAEAHPAVTGGINKALRVIGRWARILPALALLVATATGPLLAPESPDQPIMAPFASPGDGGPLGGDNLGRDVLSQVLAGGFRLVLVALALAATVTLLAATLGAVAALRPGLGRAVRAAMDFVVLFPPVLAMLVLLLAWPRAGILGLATIAIALGTPYCTRVFLSAATPVAASGYVTVAAASGESLTWLVTREILPNLRGTLRAQFGLRFVEVFAVFGTASYLGLPTGIGEQNWAVMIRDNAAGVLLNPMGVLAPSIAVAAVAASASLAASRPRSRREHT